MAVKVKVVESFGVTRRLPVFGTVPIPWSMETLVASVTDHRSVALWPRSIVDGSAENEIVGAGGFGGAGFSTGGGGGGGGGGGAFFLQPPMNIARNTKMQTTLLFRNMKLASCVLSKNGS
jgi:hypothetical protein